MTSYFLSKGNFERQGHCKDEFISLLINNANLGKGEKGIKLYE